MFIDMGISSSSAVGATACGASLNELSLGELENRIATLAANMAAADYRLLCYVEEFDRREGWAALSFRSCAHWLNYRIGLAMPAARERVRVARALKELPLVSRAMSEGKISYSKVRALTRVARRDRNEADWLNIAHRTTAHHLEATVRQYRRAKVCSEQSVQERYDRRQLTVYYDDDGSVVLKGRLPAELGATVMKAVDYYRDRNFTQAEDDSDQAYEPWGARQADALVRLCEDALAHDAKENTSTPYEVVMTVEQSVLHKDRELEDPSGTQMREQEQQQALETEQGRGGQRLGKQNDESRADEEHSSLSEDDVAVATIENTGCVSAETARRVCCDASVVAMTLDEDGSAIHVGRKRRTIPPAMRRVLRQRDGGCRFPGCTQTRYVDGHHIVHWAHGGHTALDNLVLLCRHHHRYVHEGGGHVEVCDGRMVFRDDKGRAIPPSGQSVTRHRAEVAAVDHDTFADASKHCHQHTMPLWEGQTIRPRAVAGEMLRCRSAYY